MSNERVNSFLYYGYCPDDIMNISDSIIKSSSENVICNRLIKKGLRSFRGAIDGSIEEGDDSKKHIVPLSSGLDSRSILLFLIEKLGTDKIHTLTYGCPGTYDYDTGIHISNILGICNFNINLNNIKLTERKILEYAESCERPTLVLEYIMNSMSWGRINDNESIIWSGYMGDPICGGHLTNSPIKSWGKSIDYFVQENCVSSILTQEKFDPKSVIPSNPISCGLEYVEQLDFGVRQPCYIRPTVVPDGARTPFLHKDWTSFAIRVPRQYRVNRLFFKRMLTNSYPFISSIPTDETYGLPIDAPNWKVVTSKYLSKSKRRILEILGYNAPHKPMNYIDYDYKLRSEMSDIVGSQLEDLSNRDMVTWIDVNQIWNEFLNGKELTDEIRLLFSLEIFTKMDMF